MFKENKKRFPPFLFLIRWGLEITRVRPTGNIYFDYGPIAWKKSARSKKKMYNRQCSGNIYMNLEPSVHHVKQIKRRDIPPLEKRGGKWRRERVTRSDNWLDDSLWKFSSFFFEVESLFFFLFFFYRGFKMCTIRCEKWLERSGEKPAPFETKRGVMALSRRSHRRRTNQIGDFGYESERARKTRRVKPTFWCRNLPPEDFRSVSSAEAS